MNDQTHTAPNKTAGKKPCKTHPKEVIDRFSPGDRVVAINIDTSAPIHPAEDSSLHPHLFPNGTLRRKKIYDVEEVRNHSNGSWQGLFLSGIRIVWGDHEIPWDSSRFRKAATIRNHATKSRRIGLPLSH